ncbi:MAG: 4-hydroxy-tetrahydrodipicolinate synthase [Zhaonellaceae bacterium]|nr:4-hydroxy-tetrahydrodipicolinate synthase [Clostridia bacterium]
MNKTFGRLLTAMVTPFTSESKVNFQAAAELATHLVNNGSDGLVVAGTTGESPTLTKEEKFELFKTIKEAVGSEIPVIAGTGSYSTEESIIQSQMAEKAGVDGLLLVVPYYNKPTQEGMYQHFEAIARNTSLPIMLYNIPSRTGKNMTPETVVRLSEINNIIAIKESTGDFSQLTELKSGLKNDFLIYSGDDALLLPMMALGAYGVVSVVSHLVGKQIKEMIDAFIDGDHNKALELHLKLSPLFKTMFITTNPIPIKTALALQGHQVGGFRLPLCKASDEEVSIIKNMLHKYDLL